jgi:hypothetical protein
MHIGKETKISAAYLQQHLAMEIKIKSGSL